MTLKQKHFRCLTDQCRRKHGFRGFDFHAVVRRCPECGSDNAEYVVRICTCHLLVSDASGILPGRGGNWHVACNPQMTRADMETAGDISTDGIQFVDCPDCEQTHFFRDRLLQECENDNFEASLSPRHRTLLQQFAEVTHGT